MTEVTNAEFAAANRRASALEWLAATIADQAGTSRDAALTALCGAAEDLGGHLVDDPEGLGVIVSAACNRLGLDLGAVRLSPPVLH